MHFAWENNNLISFVLTLICIVLLFLALLFAFLKVIKRGSPFVFLIVTFTFLIVSYILTLEAVTIITSCSLAAGILIIFFSNTGDFRAFLANPFKKAPAKSVNFGVERIYDRKELYRQIELTVNSLSKAKIGAIMTFEKNTSLKDIIKNGVPINCPVSSEILTTIFYPGTRLHDGAVVIHGNEIIAASVFFTPTTKPFAGKYGSRHRAAIGISEVSDAITVVVSEETGRISFAVNGQLESVTQENFLRVFENYMSDSDED